MDTETFQSLSTEAVAQLVRAAGPLVCGFPINGTRRWFALEHPKQAAANFVDSYLQICGQKHIEVYRLLFDHGISTLLTPVVGPDILERGGGYEQIAIRGLLWFAQNHDFLDFYDAYDVRVRVYGDLQRYLQNTPWDYLLDVYDSLTQRTASHQRHRLFFGVCAHDPTETVAAISSQFHQQYGSLPDKRQIIEAYYGEFIEPLSIFIGFDRLSVFDMPLLATGNEDLYFTVCPSLYLNARQLRSILYDHLHSRSTPEPDYAALSDEAWRRMRAYYLVNRELTLGVGTVRDGIWYPQPQVKLPDSF